MIRRPHAIWRNLIPLTLAGVAILGVTALHAQLHQAITNGDNVTARNLIATTSSLDSLDGNGWTPLHIAAVLGNVEILTALLERGANVRATGRIDRSARELAEFNGKREAFHVLLVWESVTNKVNGFVNALPFMPAYVQWVLSQLEFYRGAVDGVFGSQTNTAIESFRRRFRLVGDSKNTLDVQIALWTLDPITRRKSTDGGVPKGCHVCITRIWRQTASLQLESAGGCDGPLDAIMKLTAEIKRVGPMLRVGQVAEVVSKVGSGCPE